MENYIVLIYLIVIFTALIAVKFKDILSSIISLSIMGFLITISFVIMQAPDVALTQAVINSGLVTALYLVAFSRTNKAYYKSPDTDIVHSNYFTKNISIDKLLGIAATSIIGLIIISTLFDAEMSQAFSATAEHYYKFTASETGAANIVSAILFDYRAFDTLGEAMVIFLAVTGIAIFFARGSIIYSSMGMSFIVKRSMAMIIPFIIIYGLIIIFYGHLTPGGGFQGGTILATITILLIVVYGTNFEKTHFKPRVKEIIESVGGLGVLLLGMSGLLFAEKLFSNLTWLIDLGQFGNLFSAGLIPLLNILIGIKVGAGLATIFFNIIKEFKIEKEPQ